MIKFFIFLPIFTSILLFGNEIKNFESLFEEGKKNMLLENYEKAKEIFESLLDMNQNDPRLYYFFGLNFFYLKKYNQAEENFLKALDLDPNIDFAEKNDFYFQLSQIRDHIELNKILNESKLESNSEKVLNTIFFILSSMIVIIVIFIVLKKHLKNSIHDKKKEVTEEIENLILDKIMRIEKKLNKINKNNLLDQKDLSQEINKFIMKFNKIKKEYEFIQLNVSQYSFDKKEKIFKRLINIEKFLKKIK